MKKLIVMWLAGIVLLITTGCGAGSLNKEVDWKQGSGDLPAQIGDIEVDHASSYLSFDDHEDLKKKTGYSVPTGQWFLFNGNGKLGYGISEGTKRAGEDILVSVSTPLDEVLVNRNVRIQLSELKNFDEEKVLIAEEILRIDTVRQQEQIFSMPLPETENTSYILSAEILDDTGEVEDTLASIIYVPVQELNVALKTDKVSYSQSTKEITMVLENAGPTILFFGTYYTVEKKIGNTWRVVPLNIAFTDIGQYLSPGEEYEQSVEIGTLSKGQYRVVKNVRSEGTELTSDLASEFTID